MDDRVSVELVHCGDDALLEGKSSLDDRMGSMSQVPRACRNRIGGSYLRGHRQDLLSNRICFCFERVGRIAHSETITRIGSLDGPLPLLQDVH